MLSGLVPSLSYAARRELIERTAKENGAHGQDMRLFVVSRGERHSYTVIVVSIGTQFGQHLLSDLPKSGQFQHLFPQFGAREGKKNDHRIWLVPRKGRRHI